MHVVRRLNLLFDYQLILELLAGENPSKFSSRMQRRPGV